MGGFPGGAVVENLPANAGDTGSSPGLGRSHMPQLLKPACLEPVLHKRSHRNEKPVHCNEEWPPLTATREILHAETETQCSQN